jgi:hypothetical protein
MSEPFTYRLWVLAFAKQECRARVTEILEPNCLGKTSTLQRRLEVFGTKVEVLKGLPRLTVNRRPPVLPF